MKILSQTKSATRIMSAHKATQAEHILPEPPPGPEYAPTRPGANHPKGELQIRRLWGSPRAAAAASYEDATAIFHLPARLARLWPDAPTPSGRPVSLPQHVCNPRAVVGLGAHRPRAPVGDFVRRLSHPDGRTPHAGVAARGSHEPHRRQRGSPLHRNTQRTGPCHARSRRLFD